MKAEKFKKPKQAPVRELLAGNLPTTTPGVSILVVVGYHNEKYFAAVGKTPPPASTADLPMIVLAKHPRFSMPSLKAWTKQALNFESVRQRVHGYCAEHGLTLGNPVF